MSQMIELFDDYEVSLARLGDSSPFMYEHGNTVALHFDAFEVQSVMYKHAPDELVFSYTRTMMNSLVFNTQPGHVGMIGLGAARCRSTATDAFRIRPSALRKSTRK
jgi:hypothetical protein